MATTHRALSRRDFLRTAGATACAAALGRRAGAAPVRPNVLVMLADDMGYSDLGCYGSEIRTPNLDALATGGLRFTQFYNTARCCPTRASLLTGLYSHQAGIGHMVGDAGHEGYRGVLNRHCRTIAEVLRPAGYGTYMTGKWHVTNATKPDSPQDSWPRQRGFDRYWGTLVGAGSYFTPGALTDDDTPIEAPGEGFYYTAAIADHSAGFIRDHVAKRPGEPFFLYNAFTSPHWPLHALQADVERYRETYLAGWDRLREERHRRQLELGLVDPRWALTPRDDGASAWADVPADRRAAMAHRMAIYAAQIDAMDQGVGRIVEALRETGQLDHTLLLFLADNGGCAEGGSWGFERKEGGQLGTDTSFASYGLSWANASNTPFRLYKHWVHEGGISTPLIAHWPNGIAARNELRHQPGHLIDLMATALEISGAAYPQEVDGQAIHPPEGLSLLPAFGNQPLDRSAICWEHEGNRAVRQGDWKLVSRHNQGWELYDLKADRTELHDLAADRPRTVETLLALYESWAQRCGVLPWPVKQPAAPAAGNGSAANAFDLQPEQQLDRANSPRVQQTAFTVTGTIHATKPDGVVVSQGGTRVGWSLYLTERKLAFAARTNSTLTTVAADRPLPDGPVAIEARFGQDGSIKLLVAGQQVADGRAAGPLADLPTEGLTVGSDPPAAVGSYDAPNAFAGTIEGLRLVLGEG